jgi:transposase
LPRGEQRLAHVGPWAAQRVAALRAATGQTVQHPDFTDDRLEIGLRRLNGATRRARVKSVLNRYTVRAYELPTARVHVERTSAKAHTRVSEEGLFQLGHSNGGRPDLPQVNVMQAVLDPLGTPVATEGGAYLTAMSRDMSIEGAKLCAD